MVNSPNQTNRFRRRIMVDKAVQTVQVVESMFKTKEFWIALIAALAGGVVIGVVGTKLSRKSIALDSKPGAAKLKEPSIEDMQMLLAKANEMLDKSAITSDQTTNKDQAQVVSKEMIEGLVKKFSK
jgi:hypothetical protein